MDLSGGGAAGSGGEQQSTEMRGRNSFRHSPRQIAQLEAIFKKCCHPNESERVKIARELGLEPKQVRYWFQNKMTQLKNQKVVADNNALYDENIRLRNENLALREALGLNQPLPGNDDHQTQECPQWNMYESQPVPQAWHQPLPIEYSQLAESQTLEVDHNIHEPEDVPKLLEWEVSNESSKPKPTIKVIKEKMLEAGIAAKDEILLLINTDKPLWVKSYSPDQRLVLHHNNYGQSFARANPFKNPYPRMESSKDSRIVKMNAMELVNMLLDSEKWANIFSTIVTEAHTIEVLDVGSAENRSGALLLMHAEMHVLSPCVPPREFYFIRYCDQIQTGIWVIADVSVDYMKEEGPHSHTWKFPSGCLVREYSDDSAQVSWIEHVQVDEGKVLSHHLSRGLVHSTIAYGAERWLTELERICQRYASSESEYIPAIDTGRVMLKATPLERRRVMNLSHRMVKQFCEVLGVSSKMAMPHFAQQDNTVWATLRNNYNGMVIDTLSSFNWLPISSQVLYDYLKDPYRRHEWDTLCAENPMHELAHISNEAQPSNCISLLEPMNSRDLLILQESFTGPLGSYVVYSPVITPEFKMAITGEDSSMVKLLPSGVVISEDYKQYSNLWNAPNSSGGNRGSVITIAFQMKSASAAYNEAALDFATSLMISTIHNIKDALISGSNSE